MERVPCWAIRLKRVRWDGFWEWGVGRRARSRIGSVKTNIGHLEAAAGVAGLIKVALAMKHRLLPASLHFERPNPHIAFEELGIRVQQKPGPWPRPEEPAVAGISSFGFGGTNCHVVVEEFRVASPEAAVPVQCSEVAFVFSGNGAQWLGMGRGLLRTRFATENCGSAKRRLRGWRIGGCWKCLRPVVKDDWTMCRWFSPSSLRCRWRWRLFGSPGEYGPAQ